MTRLAFDHPQPAEYKPYYERYISLVPRGEITATLEQQLATTLALLQGVEEPRAGFRYAPDKWSLKEVVGHIIDTERIMAYRALRFARNDQTALPGFEQDDYIPHAHFDDRPLADLAQEFEHVRRANLYLFRGLDAAAWDRRGSANNAEVSVRALAYIVAGHERHHVEIIRTRYLS